MFREIFAVLKRDIKGFLRDKRLLFVTVFMPFFTIYIIYSLLGKIFLKTQIDVIKSKKIVAIDNSVPQNILPKNLENVEFIKGTFTEKILTDGKADALVKRYDNIIKVKFLATKKKSTYIAKILEEKILDKLKELKSKKLREYGIKDDILKIYVKSENIAPPKKISSYIFSLILSYLVVLFILVGGLQVGIDLTAGEKERKTIEALLSMPVRHLSIGFGKLLVVSFASFISGFVAVLSFALTFKNISAMIGNYGNRAASISFPWKSFILILPILLLIAFMGSALILTLASFAKTYKEAQSYSSLPLIVFILPAIAALFFENYNIFHILIPVMGQVLVLRDFLGGKYNVLNFTICFISSLFYTFLAVFIFSRFFRANRLISN